MKLETPAHETHLVLTDDGWHVALWRYLPRKPIDAPPVVLCHGLGANRFNLDFNDRYSLARYLSRKGFDVFVLELRGGGVAGRLSLPRMPRKIRWQYDFDDHYRFDIPAALHMIRELTGVSRVLWVGHSMGGMLGYGLVAEDHPAIGGLVAIAAPATFHHQHPRVRRAVRTGLRLFRRRVPAAAMSRLIAPVAGWIRSPLDDIGSANFRNMDREIIQLAMHHVVGDISRGQLEQAAVWVEKNGIFTRDGSRDYLEGFESATTPVLFVAGSIDRLAPPPSVQDAHDRLASPQKKMIILGTQSGHPTDYGHVDLILGRHSPHSLFPQIAAFLESVGHSPTTTASVG